MKNILIILMFVFAGAKLSCAASIVKKALKLAPAISTARTISSTAKRSVYIQNNSIQSIKINYITFISGKEPWLDLDIEPGHGADINDISSFMLTSKLNGDKYIYRNLNDEVIVVFEDEGSGSIRYKR